MKTPLDHLRQILLSLGLCDQESSMFIKAYLFPGLSPMMLGKQCSFSRMTTYRVIDRLLAKKLLRIEVSCQDKKRHVFAASIAELSARLNKTSSQLFWLATSLKAFEPLAQKKILSSACSLEFLRGEDLLETFMDVHREKWNINLAMGNFECYGQRSDRQFNSNWIKKRVKKGRKAKGIITAIGPFTQEIIDCNDEDLRQSRYVKDLVKDQWIELFPEIGTTFIFSPTLTEDHTIAALKIQNKAVTDSYSQIVKAYLP